MLYFDRQFIRRLLILILTIGPVQMNMAIDFDQSNQAMNCQNSQVQPPDMAEKNNYSECTSIYTVHCVDLSVCGAQYNFSSLYSSNPFLLRARAVTQLKFMSDKDAVSTHYPEPLKRPPKV
jgi:hypothetical protein